MKKVTVSLAAAMLCFGLAGPATAAIYSFSSPDVPLGIYDGDFTDAYIQLVNNTDVQGYITDVNVYVDIAHTSIGDLDIYIGHLEEGEVDVIGNYQWVQLYVHDDDISMANNMTAVTFDDEALTYINDAAPPYGPDLSFKPSSNGPDGYSDSRFLSYFDGDPAAGTWWFYLYDNYTGDTGTLNDFRLEIETADAPPAEPVPPAVPLPGAILLFGSGLGALAAVRRSRQK